MVLELLLLIRSRESNIQGTDVQQLEHERGNASRHATTRGGQSETQAEIQIPVAPDTIADPRVYNPSSSKLLPETNKKQEV